jgi:hypothetical protein
LVTRKKIAFAWEMGRALQMKTVRIIVSGESPVPGNAEQRQYTYMRRRECERGRGVGGLLMAHGVAFILENSSGCRVWG